MEKIVNATPTSRVRQPMLVPGASLGRYEILSHLATGGMADVWLARATGAGGFSKTVALKTLLPMYAASSEFVEMLIHEASVAAKIDHPGIVQIFDLGAIEGLYFIAMEYVSGYTLRQGMQRAKKTGVRIPLPIAVSIVASCADALACAHQLTDEHGKPLQLVHRDISPENVMISAAAGSPKILDFGIAASGPAGVTASGRIKGKFAYMAPEVFRGAAPDPRRDLYALGVVLYELCAGRRPFDTKLDGELIYRVTHEDPPSPRQHRAELPASLERVILRALSRSADDRPASAAELAASLRAAAAEAHLPAPDVAKFFRGLLGPPPSLSELVPVREVPDDDLPMLSPDIEIDVATSDIDEEIAEEERQASSTADLWTTARPILSAVDTGDLFPAIRVRETTTLGFDVFGAYRRRR